MDNGSSVNNTSTSTTGGSNSNRNNTLVRIIIAVVVVAAILGLIVWLTNMNNQAANTTDTSSSTNTTAPASNDSGQSTTPPAEGENSERGIVYKGNGFTPNVVTVKAGTPVTVFNNSNEALYFASDPHPSHTLNSELNLGDIPIGSSKTLTPTTKGTWGFHNHEKPGITGTLIVE